MHRFLKAARLCPSVALALAFALILTFAPAAQAQGDEDSMQAKIGVISIDNIISKSEPGQLAKKELEEKFKDLKAELEAQKQEVETLRQDMEKQSLVLSQEAKQDKQMEFRRRVRDYQDLYQTNQRRIKAEETKLVEPIFNLVLKAVDDYGQKHGYTAIFDSKSSGLVYAKESANLTREIIVEVNRAWREEQGASAAQ